MFVLIKNNRGATESATFIDLYLLQLFFFTIPELIKMS